MMKSLYRIIVFTFLLLLLPSFAFAFSVPSHNGFVEDTTETLLPFEEHQLEEMISLYQEKTSVEMGVLLIATTHDTEIQEASLETFRTWGIGDKKKNNGILMLIAKDDRKIWITTGYGVEGPLPDIRVKSIIDNVITPRFKEGLFFDGIRDGITIMQRFLDGEDVAFPSAPSFFSFIFSTDFLAGQIFFGVFIFIMFCVVLQRFQKRSCMKSPLDPLSLMKKEFINQYDDHVKITKQPTSYEKFVVTILLQCLSENDVSKKIRRQIFFMRVAILLAFLLPFLVIFPVFIPLIFLSSIHFFTLQLYFLILFFTCYCFQFSRHFLSAFSDLFQADIQKNKDIQENKKVTSSRFISVFYVVISSYAILQKFYSSSFALSLEHDFLSIWKKRTEEPWRSLMVQAMKEEKSPPLNGMFFSAPRFSSSGGGSSSRSSSSFSGGSSGGGGAGGSW